MAEEHFGPYRLEELIGRGGMGEVYRAYDTVKRRTVALKRLPAHLAGDRDYQLRFRREAELTARLSEPHIVPIHDYGEIDGRLFIDMRLITGIDLGMLLDRSGPLPPARAVSIVAQVASALSAAHAEGLTHRDVKPSNILISGGGHDPDFVHLVDFGIARDGTVTVMTATGSQIGTVEYMAPERLLHGHCDHRVDVYALGCVLFESLTASKPFTGTALAAQMYAHVHTPPPLLSQYRPELPRSLDAVVIRAMDKDPDQRFQSVAELSAAAGRAVAGGTVSGATASGSFPDPGLPVPAGRPWTPPAGTPTGTVRGSAVGSPAASRRRRLLVPAIVLGVATVAGSAAAILLGGPHGTPAAPGSGAVAADRGAPLVAPTVIGEIAVGADAADVAVTPDGAHAYVSNQVPTKGVVHRFDTATNQVSMPTPVAAGADRVAITPDSAQAYVTNNAADGDGGGSGAVSVMDTATGSVTATIHVNKPADVAFTADGSRAYVTENAAAGAVSVIDTATRTVVGRITVGAKPDGVALTPDGRYALVTNQNSNTVSVIDTARNAVITTVPTGENPIGVAVTPDGRRAYIANRAPRGTVTVIDMDGFATLATIPVGRDPINVAITPDGRRAFVTNLQANTVSVIETADNTVRHTLPVGGEPNGIAITPDGRRAYTANQDSGSISVIDTGQG